MIIEGFFVHREVGLRQQVRIGPKTVEAISADLGKPDVSFPDHVLIFPGFVDVHVHAREDQSRRDSYKEDFRTAAQAAINGGVAAYLDMPNNPCPPSNDSEYAAKERIIQEQSAVDVVPYAAITPDSQPLTKEVPYKVYMGPSVGHSYFTTYEGLEEKLAAHYRGCQVSFHCEDAGIIAANKHQSRHHHRRPPVSEVLAVKKALEFSRKFDLKATLCHLSTEEALTLALKAKDQGQSIAIELAPHHLYFTNEDETIDLQVNPPLRARRDRDFLLQMLREGRIDYLATDHAPHTQEEKKRGRSGLAHLDTYGLFVSWLIREQKVPPQVVSRICGFNPGRFFNRFHQNRYGEIAPGFEAVFTLLDLSRRTRVEPAFLRTKNKTSPFMDMTFPAGVSLLHHPKRKRHHGA